eukprot:6049845-Heterocapsa_arctica.AAC.1
MDGVFLRSSRTPDRCSTDRQVASIFQYPGDKLQRSCSLSMDGLLSSHGRPLGVQPSVETHPPPFQHLDSARNTGTSQLTPRVYGHYQPRISPMEGRAVQNLAAPKIICRITMWTHGLIIHRTKRQWTRSSRTTTMATPGGGYVSLPRKQSIGTIILPRS